MTIKLNVPVDTKGNPLKAEGIPILSDALVLGGAHYVDIFDLSGSKDRVFEMISIYNPDTSNDILIAMGADFNTNKVIRVPKSGSLVLDNMTFGFGYVDPVTGNRVKKVRALLSSTSGTLASGRITYSANPSAGQCVTLNGITYEFNNNDPADGNIAVPIGGSEDATWLNLMNIVNNRTAGEAQGDLLYGDQAIVITQNTGSHYLTITSEYGGTGGNSIPIADGDQSSANTTGATFSGSVLGTGTGAVAGVGGTTPIIMVA